MSIIDLLSKSEQKKLKFITYKENEVLFCENDKCSKLGIVMQGQLKIVSYLVDGKEIIYNTIFKNQIFGNNLIFSSEPYYKGNIIATTNSSVAYIKAQDLLSILQNNNVFLNHYLKLQSDFTKELNNKIKLLSIDSALDRFYYYMHINNNELTYASINELALNLNLQRETLSRLLNKLEKQKTIIRINKTIKLYNISE